jgi:hypothetical protein
MKRSIPSPPPPIICVNDRILLEYAVLTDTVGFRAGHGLLFLGRKEIGPVPCLAISRDKESEKVTLYFCNRDWFPIGIAILGAVEDAKKKAERIYPGSSVCWVKAQFSEEDVNRYLIDQAILFFVGKRWTKVAMVIAKVANEMGADLPQGDEGCEVVAQHIEGLVSDGRLMAQGDTKNWRSSEVRQPN